jgi:hypothetical protein
MEAREQTFGRSSQAATRRSAANILFGAAGAGTWRQTRLKRLGLMQGQPITLKTRPNASWSGTAKSSLNF